MSTSLGHYLPRFIAPWTETATGVEIETFHGIITFEGMCPTTMSKIEIACDGSTTLAQLTRQLSNDADPEQVTQLLELLIERGVLVNARSVNKVTDKHKPNKIRILAPSGNILEKLHLPYSILYGRVGERTWSSAHSNTNACAREKLISEIAEWEAWSPTIERTTHVARATSIPRFVDPRHIISYAKSQYANNMFDLTPFDPDQEYEWILGHNYRNEDEVFFLADTVLYPYASRYPRYCFSTSSGCAAHVERSLAIEHAIYELIERDAFMIFWLNKLDRPTILFESLPSTLRERVAAIRQLGFTVVLTDITMDLAPVVLVTVADTSGTYMTSGLGSGRHFLDAIRGALAEVEIALLHILNKESIFVEQIEPHDVQSLAQHEQLHQCGSYRSESHFLFDTSKPHILYDKLHSQTNTKSEIIETLLRKGFQIYLVDASSWKLDVLLPAHRYIVRVFVPGLVPLSFGYGHEPLGMDRLCSVPFNLGYRKKVAHPEELNRFPHPFN